MAEMNPSEAPMNGAGLGTSDAVGTKRQRRPSVRLGDIGGDPPYEPHLRRTAASSASNRQWKHQLNPLVAAKSSKTRTLTTLSADYSADDDKDPKSNNLDGIAVGSWRGKDSKKRGGSATKRVRSNLVSKVDENSNCNGNSNNINGGDDDKYSEGDEYGEFEEENSESPLKEQSPIQSLDNNLVGDGNERDLLYCIKRPKSTSRGTANRVRDNNNNNIELSVPSDNDMRRCGEDAVRIWLNSLGLGRYAPVFEIHEVDDEVLPMLTLEDLKDMGINAVGSRRKMFCAIQKLGKGFS